jgi:glycosidase
MSGRAATSREFCAHLIALLALLLALPSFAAVAAPATPVVSPMASPGATPQAGAAVPWWRSGVCYEVFVRSFFDSNGDGVGDLDGLIEKLDYLNDGDPKTTTDLGVTCLWLMPIMQAESDHGYDVTDYFKVERDYGTNADFRRLMPEAHKRGIRIIIDLVLNHTSDQNLWFIDAASNPQSPYRDWYIFSKTDPGYAGPWGEQVWHPLPNGQGFYYGIFDKSMPDLNYRDPAVTAEMKKVAQYWLTTMDADGFRLDAVKHLIEDGQVQENTPETLAWLKDYGGYVRQVKPDSFTVGEVSGATTDTLEQYEPDLLDEYFHFVFAQQTLNAAQIGIGRPWSQVLGGAVDRLPDERFATFLTNHDQTRTGTALNGNVDAEKMAAFLLLTAPGTPFIYYGEEIGMMGTKPDPRIRTPMQWSGGPGGGFTTGTPWEPPQADWRTRTVAAQRADPASLWHTYQQLVTLRVANPALNGGTYAPLRANSVNVVAFTRTAPGQQVLVIANLGRTPTGNLTITGAQSGLIAGHYTLRDLLSGKEAGTLDVGADGSVTKVMRASQLLDHSGVVLSLEPD